MFKIGEFSKLTQVSIRMLRYYDEAGLLKPAKVDALTGYRMYSVDQIPTLNKIIYLRDSGFQVAEITAALHCNHDSSVIAQLDKKYKEVEQNIQREQEKLNKIILAKNALLNDHNEMHYNICIKPVPSYQVLSLRRIIPNYYAEGELWKELSEFTCKHSIELTSDTFSIFHDEDYREEQVDVELCVVVRKPGNDVGPLKFRYTEPVPIMACTMVYGSFSNIASAYQTFADWLQHHSQYKMKGANRQIVHRGPWNEENPQNFLTEIQIPLEVN